MTHAIIASIQPPALADSGGLVLAPLAFEPLRVMCVDDNEDAADSLGSLLRLVGFQVKICNDAAAALSLIDSFRPEACILDVSMPGMDGCELAASLRASEGSDRLHLIAVTAHSDQETVQRTRAAGFHFHLVKPVPPQTIIDVLFEFERRVRLPISALN